MAKVTFILGLCASGKTYQAHRLIEKSTAELIDEGLHPYVDPPFSELYEKLTTSLEDGKDVVAIEMGLCEERVRKKLVELINKDVPKAEIEWICIENNLKQANKNVMYRIAKGEKGSRGHLRINKRVWSAYTYPEDAKVIPMFNPDKKRKANTKL